MSSRHAVVLFLALTSAIPSVMIVGLAMYFLEGPLSGGLPMSASLAIAGFVLAHIFSAGVFLALAYSGGAIRSARTSVVARWVSFGTNSTLLSTCLIFGASVLRNPDRDTAATLIQLGLWAACVLPMSVFTLRPTLLPAPESDGSAV